jgi:hypothetical protein
MLRCEDGKLTVLTDPNTLCPVQDFSDLKLATGINT